MTPICNWAEDEEGNWATECGHLFSFVADGPRENGFKWCCFCGGCLEVTHYRGPEAEEC